MKKAVLFFTVIIAFFECFGQRYEDGLKLPL